MFNKYYTCNVKRKDGLTCEVGSMTVSVGFFTSPSKVAIMMTNQINKDYNSELCIYDIRRLY